MQILYIFGTDPTWKDTLVECLLNTRCTHGKVNTDKNIDENVTKILKGDEQLYKVNNSNFKMKCI